MGGDRAQAGGGARSAGAEAGGDTQGGEADAAQRAGPGSTHQEGPHGGPCDLCPVRERVAEQRPWCRMWRGREPALQLRRLHVLQGRERLS